MLPRDAGVLHPSQNCWSYWSFGAGAVGVWDLLELFGFLELELLGVWELLELFGVWELLELFGVWELPGFPSSSLRPEIGHGPSPPEWDRHRHRHSTTRESGIALKSHGS